MKKLLLKFNLIFLSLILFQSCSKDDTYYDLPKEAKDLINYDIGDTFKLKNISTNEIVTLTINSKETYYYEESNAGWWLGGSGGDDYFERGEYSFSDITNCYTGTLSVEARSNGRFELTAYLGECFGNNIDSFKYQDEFFPSINIAGIEYTNVYLIRSHFQVIYYSKVNGIIQIVNNFSQETQFIIAQ